MTIKFRFSRVADRVFTPTGRVLGRLGLTPNRLTVLGLIATAVAAALIATGRPVAGAVVLVVAGLADIFDGVVARAYGTGTVVGGFYDALSDRFSDGAVLGALAWHLRDDPLLFGLTVAALVTAQMTSYARAKAEALGADCSVGYLERAERLILLVAGLLFAAVLPVVLWVLAIGGAVTVVQRVVHVRGQLRPGPVEQRRRRSRGRAARPAGEA